MILQTYTALKNKNCLLIKKRLNKFDNGFSFYIFAGQKI